jgi:hypothetical protein
MIKAHVKYFGQERDEHGMPTPYHSYLVVSSPWQEDESAVASVIPLAERSPMPSVSDKLTLSGGEQQAYEEILALLRSLPQNQELTELIDKE